MTRDLFWHGLHTVPEVDAVVRRLEAANLTVQRLRSSPTFVQLGVRDADDMTVVDLVADPTPVVQQAAEVAIGDASILADTPYEILINKLCALLSRAEYRDLVDVQALMAAGQPLASALVDAELKDGGFSPATLAWVLRGMPVAALGRASGATSDDVAARTAFRDELVAILVAQSRPSAG